MIEEIMDMVKITDMKNRLIKNLSKGYRQRVGIAQAVLGYPEVIILDEPTVGLDPKQINEIRDLIKGLKQKHTVILSSHILSGSQRRLRLRADHFPWKTGSQRYPRESGKTGSRLKQPESACKRSERHYQSRSGGRRRGKKRLR